MLVRRVVVTGIGLVTPLGLDAGHVWARLAAGETAITKLEEDWAKELPSRVAGRVPRGSSPHQLDLSKHFSSSELRCLCPASGFALVAAKEAVEDADWMPKEEEDLQATGTAIGMGMVDLDDIVKTGEALKRKYNKISPYFVPRILNNMAAGHISIKYGFQGPNHCVSTACATGNHAIGDSYRFIKYGDADVMICGGAEAAISSLGVAGFCRLRALSTNYNDHPEESSRPFDHNRDGFVMGEGAGVLVLEELSHALNRGAPRIYAEVLGYGLTGDAHHMTAPREDGKGAQRAMEKALTEAGVAAEDVGYINAHATSTPLGDAIELSAIHRLFGGQHSVQVSSTKGAIGHLLGAAGAVEAAFTTLACHAAFLPPTVNLNDPDNDTNITLIGKVGQPWIDNNKRRIALNNSFGFGGTNACLCFGSYN